MRRNIFRISENSLMALSMASLAVFAILICLNIFARSINIPFYWADGLVGVMFSVSVFFALPAITGSRDHLKVDFILSSLSERPRKILLFFIDVISFLYLAALSLLVAFLAFDSFEIDSRIQGMLGIPKFIPQALIVVCLVVSVVCLTGSRISGRHPDSGND